MKKFLLVILFIGFSDCADEHAVEDPKNYLIEDDNIDREEKDIIRPCHNNDLKCIRYYFAKNAHCSPAYGKVPDPAILPHIILPLGNSNLTFIFTDVHINGLNGKVVEFYVNKMSDRVVLALELRDLTLFSSVSYIRYHRKAKEPIVKSDYATITYRSVILTAVLPFINDMQLANAEISAFIEDANPSYTIGPKASWSKDPVVLKSYAQLVSNSNENIREAFMIQGPLFMNLFIQNSICDFGLNVNSN